MRVSEKVSDGWKEFVNLPSEFVIEAGVFEAKGAESKEVREGDAPGVKLIDVANWQEFGAPIMRDGEIVGEIPARSFIRGWFDDNKDVISARIAQRLAKQTPERWRVALEQVALWIQADIQRRIVRHIPPPLAEETIERKKSSTPLVDTGQLKASIQAKVTAQGPS